MISFNHSKDLGKNQVYTLSDNESGANGTVYNDNTCTISNLVWDASKYSIKGEFDFTRKKNSTPNAATATWVQKHNVKGSFSAELKEYIQ